MWPLLPHAPLARGRVTRGASARHAAAAVVDNQNARLCLRELVPAYSAARFCGCCVCRTALRPCTHSRARATLSATVASPCCTVLPRAPQDLLFLRNLVLDGRWEDAQAFVKPFAAKPAAAEAGFDVGKVMFALRRQKFLELLGGAEARPEVMELVEGLKQLEPHCSKEEFNNLCYCLTLTTLTGAPASQ